MDKDPSDKDDILIPPVAGTWQAAAMSDPTLKQKPIEAKRQRRQSDFDKLFVDLFHQSEE